MFRNFRYLGLVLLFLGLAAGPVRAQEPAGTADIVVRLAPDGIRAGVTLDRPVTRFAFAEAAAERTGDFELLAEGLS